MENALRYPEYAHVAEKLSNLLYSLEIDPVGEGGKNDPRADFLLALIAEMLPKKIGWEAISNAYWAVLECETADPLLRLSATAQTLSLHLNHPVASSPKRRDDHTIEDCRRAIVTAAFYLSLSSNPQLVGVRENMMDEVFGMAMRRRRRNPSVMFHNHELRLHTIDGELRAALYNFGDFVDSVTYDGQEDIEQALADWKKGGRYDHAVYQHFLKHLPDLFKAETR